MLHPFTYLLLVGGDGKCLDKTEMFEIRPFRNYYCGVEGFFGRGGGQSDFAILWRRVPKYDFENLMMGARRVWQIF